jgi:hypothetical protein
MTDRISNQELENDLQGFLNPKTPSKDFIEDLQNRLRSKAEIVVEYPNYYFSLAIVFSGLVIGIGVLWLLRKVYRLSSGKK